MRVQTGLHRGAVETNVGDCDNIVAGVVENVSNPLCACERKEGDNVRCLGQVSGRKAGCRPTIGNKRSEPGHNHRLLLCHIGAIVALQAETFRG